MLDVKAQFGDCPYIVEIETIFQDLADGKSRHLVLHSVSKLGQRLSGVHRNQLTDLVYAELAAREPPAGGNRVVRAIR